VVFASAEVFKDRPNALWIGLFALLATTAVVVGEVLFVFALARIGVYAHDHELHQRAHRYLLVLAGAFLLSLALGAVLAASLLVSLAPRPGPAGPWPGAAAPPPPPTLPRALPFVWLGSVVVSLVLLQQTYALLSLARWVIERRSRRREA
jgi:hypothetical protein